MAGTLILGDWLVVRAEEAPRENAGVRVLGGRIVEVGSAAALSGAYPHDDVLGGSGRAVLPGFVNTHMHMYGVLAHGIPLAAAPTGFGPFLREFWWPRVEDRIDHAMIRAAAAMTGAEMLLNGYTTAFDILEAPSALPGVLEAEAEALAPLGVRAVLTFEATERVSPENGRLGLAEQDAFVAAGPRAGDRITGGVSTHTTFTCGERLILDAAALAERCGVRWHMHLSESRYEPQECVARYGVRPVEYYAKLGVLGPRVIASQCVHVEPRELDLLQAAGVTVSHMPLSNCEVGGGIAPVPAMLARGIPVGLGTDGYINDPFAVMRGAFLLHKAREENPAVMPAQTVWRMATQAGARLLGIDGLGTLTVGALADLAVVDATLPTPLTADNFYDQMLLWRSGRDVRDVMVDGHLVVRDGRLLTGDVAALREEARREARRLWGA